MWPQDTNLWEPNNILWPTDPNLWPTDTITCVNEIVTSGNEIAKIKRGKQSTSFLGSITIVTLYSTRYRRKSVIEAICGGSPPCGPHALVHILTIFLHRLLWLSLNSSCHCPRVPHILNCCGSGCLASRI